MKTEASRVFSDISKEVQTLTKRLISAELEELTTRIETTLRPGVTPTMEDMFQALLKDPIWLTIVTHIQKTVEESCDALRSEVTDSLIELQEDVCIQILSENADSRRCDTSSKPSQLRHANEKGRGRNTHVRSKKTDGSKHSPKHRCSTPTPSSSTPGFSEPRMDETWYARNRGRRIKVFWPKDRQWYHGRIAEYIPEKKRCAVNYDDGDREELDLSKERFMFVSPNASKSHSRVTLPAADVSRLARKNSRPWQENPEDGLVTYPNKKRKLSSKTESNEVGSNLKLSDLTQKSRKMTTRPKDRAKSSKLTRKNSKQLKKPKQVLVQQAIPNKKSSQPISSALESPQSKEIKEDNKEKSKVVKHEQNMQVEVSIALPKVKKEEITSTPVRTSPLPVEEVKDEVARTVTKVLTAKAEQASAPQPPANSLNFIDWIRIEGPEKAVDSRVAAFIGNSWKDGIVASLDSFTMSDPNQEISVLLDLEGDETIHKLLVSLVRIQPPASCPNILVGGSCQAKDIDEWFDGQVEEIRQGVKEPVVKVMFVIPDDQRVYQWFKSSLIRMLPLPTST